MLLLEQFDAFREVLQGRGMMRNTLRYYLVTRNWLADFERKAGRPLLVGTYDLATHEELLRYLRLDRKLAQNSLYTLTKNCGACCATYATSGGSCWR